MRGETNTLPLGLAFGSLWIILAGLAVLEGVTDQLFSLSLIGGHVRLLIVIPLFFACETWVGPRMSAFVRTMAETGVVPGDALPALNREVARVNRWGDAWWHEAVCLLAAILLETTGGRLQTHGASSGYDPTRSALSAWLYFRVGLTLFQFLVFRWVWRLALWGWFLWRVSRLDLHLMPGHPDGAGGLASVDGVQERFAPLVAAISVLECASLAEDLSLGSMTLSSVYPFLAVLLLVDATVFLGPLLVFTDRLWACRTEGMGQYMRLGARYVSEFERKWLDGSAAPGEPLLGTADIQSLADLSNSVNVVRNMQWVPVTRRLLIQLTVAALVPLLPLALFKYPLAELAQRVFSGLVGL